MSATHVHDSTPTAAPKLYLAFDLGWTSWNLAFTTAMAQKPRLRTIPARDLDGLQREIQRAKQRFDLPDDTPVLSCYEAGRDGFWLHRYLTHGNIQTSSSTPRQSRSTAAPAAPNPIGSTSPSS